VSADRILLRCLADEPERERSILGHARRRGFHRFIGTTPHPLEGDEWFRPTPSGYRPADGNGPVIPELTVGSPEELGSARAALARGDSIAVRWSGERVLPLETLVADRPRSGRLWVVARTVSEVPAALGALEHGADTVVVELRREEEVDALEHTLDRSLSTPLAWERVPVTEVRSAGVGDRVIVDTTSRLGPDEGLLVGSAAAFLLLVASEAEGSRFTRPRPFRVNAGALHSYVLLADGTTRYLSELEPGDPVLAARPSGETRSVRVGRLKIERRPLTLVAVDDQGVRRTLFLQEAETVRVSGAVGRVASTALQPGERILGVRLPKGRHLGVAVQETVEER
jgi:3-dehydroquinate synthase II